MTNGWKLEQAMSAFQSARERMRVQSDDDTLAELMASETDVRTLLVATIRAAMEADAMADAAKQRMEHLAERTLQQRASDAAERILEAAPTIEALTKLETRIQPLLADLEVPEPYLKTQLVQMLAERRAAIDAAGEMV